MTLPWYRQYFGPDYWAVAKHEYTPDRTASEVRYLSAVLAELAPGRRVADLGSGVGRHAVGLARDGFDMVAVDASPWALERAAAAARAAGVPLETACADLLTDDAWPADAGPADAGPADAGPAEPFDAAICIQAFGWGGDADQLRMLRRVRDRLRPGGLLILDHSNVTAILRNYVPDATFTGPDVTATFHREYHATTGRSRGWVDVCHPDGRRVRIHDDVRLYQPPEVGRLLRAAGFAVERIDADFTAGGAVTAGTRYVQFVARAPAGPRGGSAIEDYRRATDPERVAAGSMATPAAGGPLDVLDVLDLRWTPDEAAYVQDAVAGAWQEATGATGATGVGAIEQARELAVDDPYAGVRAAPVLTRHFGVPLTDRRVTAGAGITGLLPALAAAAVPGPVLHDVAGHPDLPALASELGVETVAAELIARDGSAIAGDPLAAVIAEHRPAAVVLDRPTIFGRLCAPEAVAEIAEHAARVGAFVIVDEAYATYAGSAASVVPLVAGHDNLVVLRGVSKGYCCGGLRVGFAVAAAALTERIRRVTPPLGWSALPMAVALALLDRRPDPLAPVRRRIAEVKPDVLAALARYGLAVEPGEPYLPWVTLPDDARTRAVLRERGVMGKPFRGHGPGPTWLKLAVPVSDRRVAAFHAAFPR